MESELRQIEILTNAWDTITNMSGHDRELNIKKNAIIDELTKRIIEKVDTYLKSGK